MRTQNSNQDSDKLLDAVISDIRHQEIPPFPAVSPSVSHPASATLGETVGGRALLIGVPLLVTAAAVLVFGFFVLFPAVSNTAFAQVQEAVERVETLQYTVLDRHDNWLGKPKTFETRVVIVAPHWSRSQSEHAGIWISNLNEERQLNIKHDLQTATFYETKSSAESRAKFKEFRDRFRNIPAHATKRIGKTNFNGTPAEQFHVEFDDREFLVTINSKTKLPLYMEHNSDGFQEVFTDFVFDEEVDARLFALEVPEGYKIVEHQLADPPKFASSLVVSPESGIDECDFGSTIEKVIEYLGEPSNRKDHKTTGPGGEVFSSTTIHYNALGLRLFFNAHGLASMSCQSQARNGSTVHSFAGETGKGIRIGDTRDKLVDVYGEPDFENKESVRYVRKGISFYLDEAKVSGINISQPLDPALNFHIDPKTGEQRTWVGEADH